MTDAHIDDENVDTSMNVSNGIVPLGEEDPEPIPPDPDPEKMAIQTPIIATRAILESTYSITNRLLDFHVNSTNLTNLEREAILPLVREAVNTAIVNITWESPAPSATGI